MRGVRTSRLAAAAAVACVGAGCATMKPRAGFDAVERGVRERTGMRVRWDTGSAEDSEAAGAVRALLESELTADGAVQVALLNNRELQAVYEELSVAQADVVRAGLLRNPVFSGEVRFATGGDGTGVVLDVAQDFVSLLSMPMRKARAGAAFEAAKLRVTGAVIDAASEVRGAYYEYVEARQLREILATAAEAADASAELAERVRAAGNIRELDLLNERARREEARLDLAGAEARAAAARERLTALMGLWGDDSAVWRAPERLPPLAEKEEAWEGLEARAVAASLELGVLRREAEVAARTAGIAKPFAWLGGSEVGIAAERELEGGWSVGPSLSVPVPLFDQGQAEAGEAGARYRQAAQRLFARAVEVRSRARAAHAAVIAARDRARYYERVVLPLRERIVSETQLQYNAMQVSAFQLLVARREQVAAGAAYAGALGEYWRARGDLEQVLGGRLPRERALTGGFGGSMALGAGEGGHR